MKNKTCLVLAMLFVSTSTLPALLAPVKELSQSKSFPVARGGSLEVLLGVGNIRISPWEKGEVFVKAEGIEEKSLDRLKMTQTGNKVRVEYRPTRSHSGNISFEINVPSQFELDLRTAGGNLELEGALTGSLNGSTSGGNIQLADVTGEVKLSTSGGNILTGEIRGDALLATSGGNIETKTVSGTLEATTSGGNIQVGNVGNSLKAKTAGGNIAIGGVNGEVLAETSGGNIEAGKVSSNATLQTSGGDISLRGARGVALAKTAGGNLRLEGISGSVQAKTAGGNVLVELVPSGTGKSWLVTAGGEVKLYVPESAKASVEARLRIEGGWESQIKKYDIRSDFQPESYEKDQGKREIRATYKLNGGGESISLETVNGNIEIRRLELRKQ